MKTLAQVFHDWQTRRHVRKVTKTVNEILARKFRPEDSMDARRRDVALVMKLLADIVEHGHPSLGKFDAFNLRWEGDRVDFTPVIYPKKRLRFISMTHPTNQPGDKDERNPDV